MALKTNYKEDVFVGNRKYQMTDNGDGTVSFTDVTAYSQVGDTFGASDINTTNGEINNTNTRIDSLATWEIIDHISASNTDNSKTLSLSLSQLKTRYKKIALALGSSRVYASSTTSYVMIGNTIISTDFLVAFVYYPDPEDYAGEFSAIYVNDGQFVDQYGVLYVDDDGSSLVLQASSSTGEWAHVTLYGIS